MRKALCTMCILTIVWMSGISVGQTAKGIQGSPKLINPYLDWQLRAEDLPALARWDAVILDADQQTRYPERIRKLRELNPAIKIFAYVPTEEIAAARFSEPMNYPFGKLAAHIQEEWYVRDASGQTNFFWPGSALLNVTDRGPIPANGKRWNEALPEFIHDEILSTGLWDGVFLDNAFDAISYYAKAPVDLDRDGLPDSQEEQDRAWRAGMVKMLRKIRALNPEAILIGNGGHAYADQLHGVFFEHFPNNNWTRTWKTFRQSMARNRAPSFTALNVNTENEERSNDYQRMRYGLANALVGDGYYSFDKGDYNHNTLWWYDEYDVPLGAPRAEPRALVGGKGAAIVPAVWSREFQHGMALFNSLEVGARVPLPGVFEKIRGVQDPKTNDGMLVSTIELAPHDGLLLLRRSEPGEIRGSAFENGSFLRMYDAQGHQPQNGFFAQRLDAPSGALMLFADLNGDAADDTVVARNGVVLVRFGSGASSVVFTPFGKGYTDGVSIAVGRFMQQTPESHLVVARENGGPPEVRVFSANGNLRSRWEAYARVFSGGVRVAVGDLNGDGLNEIVTGAGPGGGPHIRIWKSDGGVWGGSFFAFDPSERGGVSVAVGDVDRDGKDEIIVASGQGAIPRVRLFDFKGTLKREIVLGTQPVAAGLRVSVADVHGDGTKEMLVSGLPLF